MRKAYREYMEKQTQLADSTRRDQEIILKNFPPIKKLNADYFRSIMKDYSAFTIWKRYGLAKRVLESHSIEHDLGTLKLPKLSRKEPVTVEDLYTAAELRGVFAACKNSRDRAMLEVLYESACRASELLSLKIENISFGGGPNSYTIIIRGKTGTRKIPLGHSITALKAWLNVHPVGKGSVWISATGEHRQMTRSHLYSIVKVALKDAGITGKRKIVHMFRHTRATELVKLGVRGQSLSKFMGWTKKSDMEATYIHLSTADMENEIAEKVYGRQVIEKRGQLVETKMCSSCGQDMLDMGAMFCPVCGFPLTQEGVRLSEQRTDNLEARIANLEDLIKQVANGKVPADKWLRTVIYEEPPKEEQERIQKELEEQIEAEEAR